MSFADKSNFPVFGPRPSDDQDIDPPGRLCSACGKPFVEGDYSTLIALGPGDDPEARQLCRAGRPYHAIAEEVHLACATGIEIAPGTDRAGVLRQIEDYRLKR